MCVMQIGAIVSLMHFKRFNWWQPTQNEAFELQIIDHQIYQEMNQVIVAVFHRTLRITLEYFKACLSLEASTRLLLETWQRLKPLVLFYSCFHTLGFKAVLCSLVSTVAFK